MKSALQFNKDLGDVQRSYGQKLNKLSAYLVALHRRVGYLAKRRALEHTAALVSNPVVEHPDSSARGGPPRGHGR